jgi:acetolactate synthase-1/2/3 large subunit
VCSSDLLLKEKMTAGKKAELEQRFRRIAGENEKTRQGWYEAARNQSNQETISADYLCNCLNQVIDEDTIVINHTLSHCASVTEQITRTKPGTWFGCPSGAIGWAPGAALGAAAASPGRTVVAAMTDGGFVWGCPTAVLWASAKYGFPFLTLICNNNGYGVVRNDQYEMPGENRPGEQSIAESAVNFQPGYALIAQGAGAFGRKVTKPADVLPALKEALAAVHAGKPAVLDIQLPEG